MLSKHCTRVMSFLVLMSCAIKTHPFESATGNETSTSAVTDGSSGPPTTTDGMTGVSDSTLSSTGSEGTLGSGSSDSSSNPAFCEIWTQDCPRGMKCKAYGDSYENSHCVPLVPNPGGPLDPCEVMGRNEDAVDSCDEWSVCWFLKDPPVGSGVCLPICSDMNPAPECPKEWLCVYTTQDSQLFRCLPPCDPTLPTCPGASSCAPDDAGFHCEDSFTPPAYGEPCLAQCKDGLFCSLADNVPGCAPPLCCTTYCNLNVLNPCPAPEQTCVSYYQLSGKPEIPQYAHVGLCVVP